MDPPDPRLNFIVEYSTRALKIKAEKWTKALTLDEVRLPLLNFLDQPGYEKMLIFLAASGALTVQFTFPPAIRNRTAYFIKRDPNNKTGLPKVNFKNFLVYGELSAYPLDQLSSFVDEVLTPMLCNSSNVEKWTKTVAEDVIIHTFDMKSGVYQLVGQLKGKTLLPMPRGMERLRKASRLVASKGVVEDTHLLHSIESSVIMWLHQVAEIRAQDSSKQLKEGKNPGPMVEISFWKVRCENLKSVFGQLHQPVIQHMKKILEAANSSYYPAIKRLYQDVDEALTEADEIYMYLSSIQSYCSDLEVIDIPEARPKMIALMNTVCLIWANSKYYTTKMIVVLLKEISNLFIDMGRNFVDSSTIFQAEIVDVMVKLNACMKLLKDYKDLFFEYREKLPTFFQNTPPKPWDFPPSIIFNKVDAFIKRIEIIQTLLNTAVEYMKMDKGELSGIKGKTLSIQVLDIYREFMEMYSAFSNKSYDFLDIDSDEFIEDMKITSHRLQDFDLRMGAILVHGFFDCNGAESIYKLFDMFGEIIKRPLVAADFEPCYMQLVKTMTEDMDNAWRIYIRRMRLINSGVKPPIHKNWPPVAGNIKWASEVKQRISIPMHHFKQIKHRDMESEEAKAMEKKYTDLMEKLDEYEASVYDEWASNVNEICYENLHKNLLTKDETRLAVNFNPQLQAVLREVKYHLFANRTDIPSGAMELYENKEKYTQYNRVLQELVNGYNFTVNDSLPVEYALIAEEVETVNSKLTKAIEETTWESKGVWEYIVDISQLVGGLEERVQGAKENVHEIQEIVDEWSRVPLYHRKDDKKDGLLQLDNRLETLSKRYAEIKASGLKIKDLVWDSLDLFECNEDTEDWAKYEDYIDDIVLKGFRSCIETSLKMFADNMNPTKTTGAFIEIRMDLIPPELMYTPSMSFDDDNGYFGLMEKVTEDIFRMATLVERVSKTKGQSNYLSDMDEDEFLIDLHNYIMEETKVGGAKVVEYSTQLEKYAYLWTDSRQEFLDYFLIWGRTPYDEPPEGETKPTAPTLNQFKEQIDFFENLYLEVEQLQTTVVFRNWLKLDMRPFKQGLLNTVKKWSLMIKTHLQNFVMDSLNDLDQFNKSTVEGLSKPLKDGDYDGLVNTMGNLLAVRERVQKTDAMFEPIKQAIELLKSYDQEVPEDTYTLLQELPEKWANTKKVANQMKQTVGPLQAVEVANIKKKVLAFEARQNEYRDKFRNYDIFKYECQKPYVLLDRINNELKGLEKTSKVIQESANLFEVSIPDFKMLKLCRKEIRQLKQIWDFISLFQACVEDWKSLTWKFINVDTMDIECKKFAKELKSFDKEVKSWDLFIQLDLAIKNLMSSFRAIGSLQNTAIRDRHWKQLSDTTKVRFSFDDSSTLAELLTLNLFQYEEEVLNIVDKSVKEMGMEKTLKDLKKTWTTMEFNFDVHPRTKMKLLKCSEELTETLEADQVALQTMLTSKFIAYFFEEVNSWQQKLSLADQVIGLWLEVQRSWTNLESIFIGSEDIRKQLPVDSKRFENLDKEFRACMIDMAKTPNVVKGTSKKGLVKQLESIQDKLSLCEKALFDYLETKKLQFPRFYFISSTDLLEILSTGQQPELVARHLAKLFDSMSALKFKLDAKKQPTKIAIGMYAKDGEYMAFDKDCSCQGQVENWLNNVLASMKSTIRYYLTEAVVTYEEKPREMWLMDYAAEVALVGTQIWWATEVNMAFARLEEGFDTALKDYYKKQIQQLNTMITMLLGDLTPGDRQKIMTICTIDVHARDVVAKMVQQKVENSGAFVWQSQLRHRWDEKFKDCFANICDAQFRFSHEYLGCTPRLVITPLTDRCYITLTQSLHLILGGAPAGPAGTGKTETTKDLGKALGIMVYVFNCSEQMDYKSLGDIFKGLAQSGAWGCFDEFNRISVEVLSVCAVQVKCVQDAIRDKKDMFNFLGDIIKMVPTTGAFITMNPGYAGRTELPENLKALFRPCAMVVPDFELICEIMLVAEGFLEGRLLARKFITLYTLCKELLSKQDHYDWGLRAIKSVLVVAGSLKRGDRDRPEDQVLMRALRDFNTPKMVTDDMPVFLGLIGDLFPNLQVPRKTDPVFEKQIKDATLELGLQPEESFILKVVQFQELLNVRHSVFIIGSAGTGKSEIWRALNRTYLLQKRKAVVVDLDPKAVTNDELFGIINPATREWKDGLFSVIMRDMANLTHDGPKWIMLDGDIDPMWIESLNTVMDDNKILTLASNERIALTPHMRLVFEILDLKTATPATVSRAGILFVNPNDLGWNPFVTSWIDTREVPSEKANLFILFDRYVPQCLEIVRLKFKKVTPITEISHIHMLCYLLEALLTPDSIPPDSPKETYELYFVFACIWAFGAPLQQEATLDSKTEFSKWFTAEFKSIKFPPQGNIFDYYIDNETKKFVPWTDSIPSFELDPEKPLQATLVHSSETFRVLKLMDLLMMRQRPVMLVGNAGSGKTVLIQERLGSLREDTWLVANVPFNFYTTSEMLQKILEKPLEKKAGRNYGPPGNKRLIYFVDDMNMPEVDQYFTVQPHTIIRQHILYNHWYDRKKLSLKEVRNCQYVSAMNPTAGSFTITPKLQRLFCVFTLAFPGVDALERIYSSILNQFLENPEKRFSPPVIKLGSTIIDAEMALHKRVSGAFLPTAIKFHYIFNLRDTSNIFQGILFTNGDIIKTQDDMIRLWLHEAQRVYCDKMMEPPDLVAFDRIVADVFKKSFEDGNENLLKTSPLIFCHFALGLGEPKYRAAKDWGSLTKILTEALEAYNEMNAVMNLVLFEDAIQHICRINRILELPRGNALLIGVGGSGKQSLTRLASYVSSKDIFQITLRRGYGIPDLKTDIAELYMKTGVKSFNMTFLMTDAQVDQERFLVLFNDMLASGEVTDLFADDECESIINSVRPDVKRAGIFDSRENCWKFFINRVRSNLKVVLCFSPVGNNLRNRARKFPALINNTSIDWFHEWPEQALMSVCVRFLSEQQTLEPEILEPISKFMANVHLAVNEMSKVYLANERRYNYTTPKSFLELISLYQLLVNRSFNGLKGNIDRLENGLAKLKSTGEMVDDLKSRLGDQEIELRMKNEAADKLIEAVGIETEKVYKEKAIADEEELKVHKFNADVLKKQQECESDLEKAEPALLAAQEALNSLNKANITELKSFASPPPAVLNVTAAVILLMSSGTGKIPKDRSWKAAKVMMGKVDQFLDDLLNFNKESIPADVIRHLQPYLRDPDFNADIIKAKSLAAGGLCQWVLNIVLFNQIYNEVEPKRRALEQANVDLSMASDKLTVIKTKINRLEDILANLNAQFEKATNDKLRCQQEADRTALTISLANRLIGALGSEKVRWANSVALMRTQETNIPGDVGLVSSFVSYLGCFTRPYRVQIMNTVWIPLCVNMKPDPIPITEGLDYLTILTDDAQVAAWNNESLPSDRMSTENATILTNSQRWSLMIDPQLQGVKWIKTKYTKLKIIRLGQKNYLENIELAISSGSILLLENIGESVDAVLDHVLGRNTIKRGRFIKMGDKEVEYNPAFKLILQTKLANPHYPPEMQAQLTLINFTVTRDGLEDQLLAEVVNTERPDLEATKADLTRQQNQFKIMMKDLEDSLLMRLSSATGDILGDTSLVDNLEYTKKTAAEVQIKVAEALKTEKRINATRELYRPAGCRSSIIYFVLTDLNKIHPFYSFSLKAFKVVFHKAIKSAAYADDIATRVVNLVDSITYSVFQYTKRGLFECDKLTFTTQMAIQILVNANELELEELDFLLRYPFIPNLTTPVDFLSHQSWGGIKSLSGYDEFKGLDKDIEGSAKRWKKFVDSECPEREKFPQEWKNKTILQRLCMLRALRPDRMSYAMYDFVEEKLGAKYVEAKSIDFAKSYEESGPATPVLFVLSAGVDPLKDVEALGKKLGFTFDARNFHNVSLGQGQEVVAEAAMELASANGHWVILQNVHLVKKWLPTLEKRMEAYSEGSHVAYRLYISAEPAADPAFNVMPQGILENCIKITNEPPTGIKANLHKALDNFDQETLEMSSKESEFKSILFSVCYFHAVVAERRKFGPQGWNRNYPFNVGDLTVCVNVLYNYLENNARVPWVDLRYLFGEIMYGGHITDDWDRRLCRSYLEVYMQPEQLEGDLFLAPGFPSPLNMDYYGYHRYIDETLPGESPYLYGLHPNAEIGFLTTRSEQLFRTVLEMQPRDSGAGAGTGVSREEKVKQVLDEINEKLPEPFNLAELMSKTEDRSPFIVVAFQECDRMNILTKEMRRTLREMNLGLKGELTISAEMEALSNALFLDQVPAVWAKRAYPSLLPLASWYADLLIRVRELDSWVADFNLPPAVWLTGFFNPQSFLTAIMQTTARRNELPLDKMCLQVDVTKKQKDDFTSPPREGANICGLFMEGARWDTVNGCMGESLLKELFAAMPVIYVKAIQQDKADTRNQYACPLYKTRTRGITYVWTFNLKTKLPATKWVLCGVALLLQV